MRTALALAAATALAVGILLVEEFYFVRVWTP